MFAQISRFAQANRYPLVRVERAERSICFAYTRVFHGDHGKIVAILRLRKKRIDTQTDKESKKGESRQEIMDVFRTSVWRELVSKKRYFEE